MSGAEAGGARVAVLGLGASRAQAADLTVGAIHHFHELSTPAKGAQRWRSGLAQAGVPAADGGPGSGTVKLTYLSMKSRLGLCSSSPG